ncbi:MAG: OadG family protein [Chloroflexales bacterium]|nr:OadG family protein [Chloroflexales bacterium]
MSEQLAIALQITLLGMGLVFGAILLLWLVMDVLVRFTAERDEPEVAAPAAPPPSDMRVRRQQVAAIAVAVALAQENAAEPQRPVPSTTPMSAWQAVMRGRQLKQRGRVR